jgi:hypothetical protein
MGFVFAPVRRSALIGALVVGLALAMVTPAAAFAANTATFSFRTPASGAAALTSRPTISAIAYDRYGISGPGSYAMTVDGKTVIA